MKVSSNSTICAFEATQLVFLKQSFLYLYWKKDILGLFVPVVMWSFLWAEDEQFWRNLQMKDHNIRLIESSYPEQYHVMCTGGGATPHYCGYNPLQEMTTEVSISG